VVATLARARQRNGKPKAIVLRTLPGKGVRRIEQSEKSHFFRVDIGQWDSIIDEFEHSVGAGQ
jgi:transketolase